MVVTTARGHSKLRRPVVRRAVRLWARALNVLHSTIALARLVASLHREPLTELWIGDSHAQHFNHGPANARLFRGSDRQFVYHHGPRLMYSIATRGFDEHVQSFARLVRRLGSSGRIVPIFSAGEIDVRCHLVPRSSSRDFSFDFVDAYVERCVDLAQTLGATTLVLAIHPPVSPTAPDRHEYPVRGAGDDRIAMSEQLRQEVHRAAADRDGDFRILVLDATKDLADARGALRDEVTDDQIHTNAAGIAVVRARLRDLRSDT